MPINIAIPPEYCPASFANQMNILLEMTKNQQQELAAVIRL